jgi:hypothetical protein
MFFPHDRTAVMSRYTTNRQMSSEMIGLTWFSLIVYNDDPDMIRRLYDEPKGVTYDGSPDIGVQDEILSR